MTSLILSCGEAERHGGEHVVEQSYLPHGGQETERIPVPMGFLFPL
jgi:hypothetical protein